MERNDAAANYLFSSLNPGSNFQKAFSKAASISLDDTRCGRAKSRPRLSASFLEGGKLVGRKVLDVFINISIVFVKEL